MKFQINEKTKLKTTKFELDLGKGHFLISSDASSRRGRGFKSSHHFLLLIRTGPSELLRITGANPMNYRLVFDKKILFVKLT